MKTRPFGAIKAITLILIAAAGTGGLAGCASMKQKFIRKPKERVVQPVVYTQDKYVKQYSHKYYYTTHFSNWRTWQDELLNSMGTNAKRQERAIQEVLQNLVAMQKYLNDPKKSELGVQIAEVQEAEAAMESGKNASDASVRLQLERTRRIINSGFYFDKVKDSIVPDEVDLGTPEPDPAPAMP